MNAHDQESMIGRLESAAALGRTVTFIGDEGDERVEWSRLHDDARAMAAALQRRGVVPGDRVALFGRTSRSLVTAVQATWLAGATLMMLPLRYRLTPDREFHEQTQARIAVGDCRLIVAEPDLAAAAESPGDTRTVTSFSELALEAERDGSATYERPVVDGDDIAILQFTSGSTADPRGVMIPQRCLTQNVDAISDRQPMDPDSDLVVSWAPLYHDMGLIMLLVWPMTCGIDLAVSTPDHFINSPRRWMEWMATFGATWSIAPNFAFGVSARLLATGDRLDLSRCRHLGNGSEPIDPQTMDLFATAAAQHGLDPLSIFGAYGMAEATVLISIPDERTGLGIDVINGAALENDRHASPVSPDHSGARRLARCGKPIRDLEARIVDPDTGVVLGSRDWGELEVRGPSVVPGYFRNPDATAAAFRDGGWLRTGDLAYFAEEDLVICGRLKDVIIVGGRNLFPQDFERAAETVDGVRKGNVIAFGVAGRRGREAVVVVAEAKTSDIGKTRDALAHAVGQATGVRPDDVVLIATGTLPKTSSGKLRRTMCRSRYLGSELQVL
jgi:fatty-acyl-CoA synthase